MRRYETTYILRPNLGEEQFSEIIERTNNIVTGDGGAIIDLKRLGNRKLAYEIKKETLGQYIYFDFAAPGSTILEMERIFRIDDSVLRFLTVKLADSIDEGTISDEIEKIAAIEAEKAEAEAAVESTSADDTSEDKEKENADAPEDNQAPDDDEKKADAPEDNQASDDNEEKADDK
jgi:small subunit ribosomal protein S6